MTYDKFKSLLLRQEKDFEKSESFLILKETFLEAGFELQEGGNRLGWIGE